MRNRTPTVWTSLLRMCLPVLLSAGAAVPVTPARADDDVVVSAGKDGFSLQSRGGAFVLRLRGGFQADSRFFLADTQKQNLDTFLGRRVRPILEGTVHERFDFRLTYDLVDGRSNLIDAYMDVRPSAAFKIRVGKFKCPIGLERIQSFTDLRFVERAYPTALAPNRDYGVLLHGDLPSLAYAAGIVNGAADGGSLDSDVNEAKDVIGRIFVTPFAKREGALLQGLGFGIAGTWGDQAGALASYRSTGQASVVSFVSGVTADDERMRLQPQGCLYKGPLGLLGEYGRSEQVGKKEGQKTEFKAEAFSVAATYLLTGEKASFRGVTPNSPFNFHGGTGAVELAARYHTLYVDPVIFEKGLSDPTKSVRRAATWGGGANWYLNKNTRFTVAYELTEFRRGAVGSSNRRTERVVQTRYQLAF